MKTDMFTIAGALIFAVICVVAVRANDTAVQYRSRLLNKANDALQSRQYDSALRYYAQAHNYGMSKDSLYFFWGEVYRERGNLDTALALNYSILPQSRNGFRESILLQRRAIYDQLGWEDKSEAIGDSIEEIGSKGIRAMPELAIRLSGGYRHSRRRKVWKSSQDSDSYTHTDRFPYSIDVESEWMLWHSAGIKWNAGAGGGAAPPLYEHGNESQLSDSLEYDLGAFVEGVFDDMPIRIRYSFRNTWDVYARYYHVHEAHIASMHRGSFPLYTAAGFHQEVACSSWQHSGRLLWLFAGISLAAGEKATFDVSGFCNAYFSRETALSYYDTLGLRSMDGFSLVDYMTADTKDTVVQFVDRMPASTVTPSVSVEYKRTLGDRISAGGRGRWSSDSYLGCYEWQTSYPAELLYNRRDSTLYYSEGYTTDFSELVKNQWPPTQKHTRIDHTLGGEVYFIIAWNRITCTPRIYASRTWSSLPDEGPTIDIPRWEWGIRATLDIAIGSMHR